MRALFLLLVCLPAWAGGLPHLDLDLRLDPGKGTLSAEASLDLSADHFDLQLVPTLKLSRLSVDGQTRLVSPGPDGAIHLALAGGAAHKLQMSYHGTLAALPDLDQRQVLARLPPMAAARGSFLPAGSGWYPDPGVPFSYRVRLRLPTGQKGLVPGTLVEESDHEGYHAEYVFAHPAEGIALMAGPYTVQERLIPRAGQPPLRLRTWFYPELADLAAAYLDDSARYIARYSERIGPYPFDAFSVVASPLPTGFGMPSLTYLGRDVLRLPFIRATSLGHEVLHNWWGNGVIPDWATGNWSEGLTTFMADYAYKEDQSETAAREARLAWLRDLAAVPEAEDTPLTAFTARHHGISSIVGYDKAAMVFFMLRDRIGAAAFDQGLRLFWQRHRFGQAAWADLEHDFAEASGQDLAGFFRQWVERAGAPRLKLNETRWNSGILQSTLEQGEPPYELRVPVRLLVYPGRVETRWLEVKDATTRVRLPELSLVQAVDLDPDYRIWRRIERDHFPPILREVFVAPHAGLLLASADADKATDMATDMATDAAALAERLLDARPEPLQASGPGLPGGDPVLIVGQTGQVAALLARLGLPPAPPQAAGVGSARVWAARDASGRPYAVVSVRDRAALQALQRPLPHYGGQSWLLFDAAHLVAKGILPALPERTLVATSKVLNQP